MNQTTVMSAVCVTLLVATAARAQTPGAPPDPQARLVQLEKDLVLSESQKPAFEQILTEERTALGASMKQEREQNTDLKVAHENHQKIEDAAMAKLKPVLSEAQYKKYQGIVEAEAYARHHRASAAGSAPGP